MECTFLFRCASQTCYIRYIYDISTDLRTWVEWKDDGTTQNVKYLTLLGHSFLFLQLIIRASSEYLTLVGYVEGEFAYLRALHCESHGCKEVLLDPMRVLAIYVEGIHCH